MSDQRARETALRRRAGQSPEARARVAVAESEMIWQGKCRKCGTELKGTRAELTGHTCDG